MAQALGRTPFESEVEIVFVEGLAWFAALFEEGFGPISDQRAMVGGSYGSVSPRALSGRLRLERDLVARLRRRF